MATKCFTVVRGKRLRITRLDECGNPPAAATADSFVVSSGFVTVGLSAVIAAGTDIEQMNADGDLCVSDRSRDQFRRWDVEIELCDVDPAILGMLTNVTLEEDWEANVVGVRQPEGASVDTFALELWTGVPGTDCLPGEPTTYGYLLLPTVIPGNLGDITVENGNTTFSVGGFTRGAGGWGFGPFDVIQIGETGDPGSEVPEYGPLETALGPKEHMLLRTTTLAPPDAACGAQAMPA